MKQRGYGWMLGLWLLTAIVAAVAVRKGSQWRAENEVLRAELQQERLRPPLELTTDTPSRYGGMSRDDKMELMRLRNEVTQLKASVAAAGNSPQDAQGNQPEAARQTATMEGSAIDHKDFPKEQWSFRGYATPEDAVVSSFWALSNGDLEQVMESMPPGDRTEWQNQRAKVSEEQMQNQINREFGDLSAFRLTQQKQVSPTQIIMDLEMVKPQQISTRPVHLFLVGNEWKVQSLINTYDPLAFYRKNPELMRRYFPHLFRQNVEQQQNVTAQPPQVQPAGAVETQGTLPPEPSPNE